MTPAGDWPHTTRALPWLLASFMCVLWLVPIQAVQLDVPLPIDPTPERFLLLATFVVWSLSSFARRSFAPGSVARGFTTAFMVFLFIALVSVLLNAERLATLGEIEQPTKKLFVLIMYAAFFCVVATTIRASELRNFAVLMIGLASIVAVGAIWEYRTNYNVFYDVAKHVLSPFASVADVPNELGQGRKSTFGPTSHGLALTAILALALPFAVLAASAAKERRNKILFSIAVALILGAGLATLRKTSAIAPAVALAVLVAYRPRDMLRLIPLGIVMLAVIHVVAPAAITSVSDQFTNGFFSAKTTEWRTSDYGAVAPDFNTYPLVGRGYGTIDPTRDDTYRILDNEYLGTLVQVGFLGLAAYIALIMAALALAHRGIRHGLDEHRRSFALACSAAFASFGVANLLFDVLSFPQVPYLFFFLAGLCSVAASRPAPAPSSEPERFSTELVHAT